MLPLFNDPFIPHAQSVAEVVLAEISDTDIVCSLNLWRDWAKGANAPIWRNIALEQLPARIAPMTSVMDVVDGGADFRCRYWGSQLTALFGRDETGKLLSEHPIPVGKKVRAVQFRKMMTDKRPRAFQLEFKTASGRLVRKLNVRLPIVHSNGELDKILTLSSVSDELD